VTFVRRGRQKTEKTVKGFIFVLVNRGLKQNMRQRVVFLIKSRKQYSGITCS